MPARGTAIVHESMEINDATLLADSRRGHTEAFAVLVERYQSLVCAVTYSMTGDRAISEDLAQDTFLTAWRSLTELREPERFRGWLCGIARNLSSKARRRMGRTTELPHEGSAEHVIDQRAGPEDALATKESEAMVWRVLERIPETYREPLVLYYREGRSAKQVALALGLSVSAVEQRLSRGRRQLEHEVERVVGRALERSRPSAGFTAGVVAALPRAPIVVPLPPSTSPSPAPTGAASRNTTMKTMMIAATMALALGSAGYGLSVGWGGSPDDPAASASASPTPAASHEGPTVEVTPPRADARAEHEQRAAMRARLVAANTGEHAAATGKAASEDGSIPPYELTHLSPVQVTVDLDGGPSTLRSGAATFGMPEAERPPTVRTIRGRVVDERGRPVAGAIVVGGKKLSCVLGNSLSGQVGATTGADGAFTLEVGHADALRVVAMHHGAGWSAFAPVTAGTTDARLELALGPTATLVGTVTRDEAPFEADVWLRLADDSVGIRVPTDARGHYRIDRIPAGTLSVSASAPMMSGLGTLPRVEQRVVLRPSTRTQHDIEIPVGAFIAVVADLPDDHEARMLDYTLLAGEYAVPDVATLARLRKELPRAEVQGVLFGGIDLDDVAQFNDVPEGPITICVEALAQRDESLGLACELTQAGAPGDDGHELHLRPVR